MANNENEAQAEKGKKSAKAVIEKSLAVLGKKGLGAKKKKKAKAAKPAENDENAAQDDGIEQGPDKFRAAVLFIIMILFILLVFVEGSSGWKILHDGVRGVFGITVLLVPVLIGIAAWNADSEDEDALQPTLMWCSFLTVIVAGAVQVLFNGGTRETDFTEYIKYLYQDGVENTFCSGGGISVLLAYPLLSVLGTTGARIIMVLLLITIMFWASKKSPRDLLMSLISPFRKNNTEKKDENLPGAGEVPMDYVHGDQQRQKLPLSKRIKRFFTGELEYDMPPVNTGNEDIYLQDQMYVPEDDTATYDNAPQEAVYAPEEACGQPPENYMPEGVVPYYDEEPAPAPAPAPADQNPNADLPENGRTPYGMPLSEADRQAEAEAAEAAPVKSSDMYLIPPLHFLNRGTSRANDSKTREELTEKAAILHNTLKSFGVEVRITDILAGPAVTRYEIQPAAGVKVSKITGLADDIALSLAASGVRIEAPIPGKSAIGVEVPNTTKETVALRDILESDAFRNSRSKLTFAVGKDITGNPIIGDVAKMPHMIIAGTTGSGKSVCTNSIIMSLLMNATPDEVKLILIDPKIVEFRVYEGIPHLLIPVVTDPKKAAGALNWAVQEMLRRYKQFAEQNVRDIYDYNEKAIFPANGLERMCQIVIAIDELADLMMAASKEVEDAICRLTQMARAAGMHLIIATQRPTTDIITGLIKANIPSRIALSVKGQIDSRTILDMGGAEKLLGHGDMLYLPNGQPKPVRVQGCYTSTTEIERVVEFIKNQAQSSYDSSVMEEVEQHIPVTKNDKAALRASSFSENDSSDDSDEELIEQAMEIVVQMGQASTSSLQRRLKLGYARAARITDELEKLGVVGPNEGAKPRRVLMSPQQLAEHKARRMHAGN